MNIINFAQKALITNGKQLLLVKKSADDPHHPNEWEIPGGRIEFGESLEAHIKREIMEEVGLDIVIGKPFGMWTWIMKKGNDNIQVIAVASICTVSDGNVTNKNQVSDDFLSQIEWVDYDKVLNLPIIPDVFPVIKRYIGEVTKNETTCQ